MTLSRPFVSAMLFAALCAPANSAAQAARPATAGGSVLAQARRRLAANDFQGAREMYARAVATRGAAALSEQDTLGYATALARTGDAPQALAQITSGLQRYPRSAALYDADGTLLAQTGDLNAAIPMFRKAVEFGPGSARATFHLGTALLETGNAAGAIPVLQKAAQQAPADFETQLQLGRALSEQHEDAEALVHLHRAADLLPAGAPPQATYALGLALQSSGDAKAALPLLDAAVGRNGGAGSSELLNDALAHMQTGDAPGAIEIYKEALAIGPDTPTLREDLGAAYLQQADLNDAVSQFQAGLAQDPQNPQLHYDLGLAYKLKDDLAAAVPEFQKAAQLDPSLQDPPYTLGLIYMQQGKFPDAATEFRKAVALQPANGDAWALLGDVLKQSGDNTGALDALQHAIALQPNQPSLHIQLAAIYMGAGDRAKAIEERKTAAELSRAAVSRQRASFALKSGLALMQEGKLPEAITQLTTAADADPSSPEPHRALADIYRRQGRTTDAAMESRRAQALAAAARSSPKAF